MQEYTKKKLRDIKIARYKEADDELFKNGPALISGGNSPAYRRNFWEYHTRALKKIIRDINKSEKKALSRMTAFPMTRYFSKLKKEIFNFINREIPVLNKKLENQLPPDFSSHKPKIPFRSTLSEGLSNSLHGSINREVDRLELEIRYQRLKKLAFWVAILAILPLLAFKGYLISLVKYFIR